MIFDYCAEAHFWKNERGSASIEFVALAIPLFIPIIFFLHHFAAESEARSLAQNIARQTVHAYWTGSSYVDAVLNAAKTARATAESLGATPKQIDGMEVDTKCSADPCWGPDVTLTISISIPDADGEKIMRASASETSSHWAIG